MCLLYFRGPLDGFVVAIVVATVVAGFDVVLVAADVFVVHVGACVAMIHVAIASTTPCLLLLL